MEHWLRVDCDFEAEGLWDRRGRMIPVVDVPISEPLQRRILAWQAWYSETAEPWNPANRYDWELHRSTAIDISRCIKRELPDWTIVALERLIRDDGSVGDPVLAPGDHIAGK